MKTSSKVALMFREFIKDHEIVMEGRGLSIGSSWKLPITHPMAFFISLFPGVPLRTKILQWFLTKGLVQASQGRDQLAKMVNDHPYVKQKLAEKKNPRIAPQQGYTGTAAAMGEAFEAGLYHDSPESGIYPHDLFSPEARQRFPFLNDAFLNGATIDSYFEANFEPTHMDLSDISGDWNRIDIGETNYILEGKGLPKFRYGGLDGYLQYVEKGDYLPPRQQRAHHDLNQQHGPDMSQGKMEMTPEGRMVANFFGGGISLQSRRYQNAVMSAQVRFNRVANNIEKAKPIEVISPEMQKLLTDLLKVKKDIEKVEKTGGSRYGLARTLGLDRFTGKKWEPDPNIMDEENHLLPAIEQAIKLGLKQPFRLWDNAFGMYHDDLVRYGILESYNIETLREQTKKGGYKSSSFECVWSDAVADILYKEMMKDFPESINVHLIPTRILHSSPEFQAILAKKAGEKTPEILEKIQHAFSNTKIGRPGQNVRVMLSTALNAGLDADPDLGEAVKFVGYELRGVSPKELVTRLETRRKLFANDIVRATEEEPPMERELKSLGYQWRLKPEVSKEERGANARPDWLHPKRDSAVMVLSVDTEDVDDIIKIVRDGKQLFAEVPVSSGKGGEVDLKTVGMPTGMMLGGGDVKAGTGLGHMDLNPPQSEEEWNDLEEALLSGEMGEPIDHEPQSILQTLSVVEGALRAMRYAHIPKSKNNQMPFLPSSQDVKYAAGTGDPGGYDGYMSGGQILSQAKDALWGFAGDRAFQIGYVTPDEIKWDQEEEMARQRGIEQAREDPDFDERMMKTGQGLNAIMIKYGIDPLDNEEQFRSIQDRIASLRGNYWYTLKSWAADPNDPFTPEMLAAIGENAFEARKNVVARRLGDKLKTEYEKWKLTQFGAARPLGGDAEGHQGGYEDMGKVKPGAIGQEIQPDIEGKEKVFGKVDDPKDWKPFGHQHRPPGASLAATSEPTTIRQPRPSSPKVGPVQANDLDLDSMLTQAIQPTQIDELDDMLTAALSEHRFIPFRKWREMVGTYAPYDGTKPRDGGGFNWWGAAGDPLGVSISGDANTSKKDPTGKGKLHGKKRGRKK